MSYNPNRQSIADIEEQLYAIFNAHPLSRVSSTNPASSEPVIPADALVDVLREFSAAYGGTALLADDEVASLERLLEENPTIEVTPQILLQFIAARTGHSPDASPPPPRDTVVDDENDDGAGHEDGDGDVPPTVPPKTPAGAASSPFDTLRRQRVTPLHSEVAPSSWTRRPVHERS